ncbi:MAG TPA: isoprenylcysteine carboxylmethyltransferase family protein [Candidatus Acidoferrales bacterium]|nr:isoprenylcysteine carboxylmethyltransferase family protein [Candidatus Acidoferrales bacterium]
MQSSLDWIGFALFLTMVAFWLGFTVIFVLHKKPPKTAERIRDPKSLAGLRLQSIAYVLSWIIPRANFGPIISMPKWAEIIVAVIAIVVAAFSLWLMWRAIVTLGKQWAYVARIVEGHNLVTEGPYGLVRNPIYTGMFGMLVATGLAASRWPSFLAAIVIFLFGTWVRIRREESLLRQSFGAEFEAYCSRVPALFPGLFR